MQDGLVEVVVLPAAGDLEVFRCHADLGEAVVEQYLLRGVIINQGACFDPVQTEMLSCFNKYCSHRA